VLCCPLPFLWQTMFSSFVLSLGCLCFIYVICTYLHILVVSNTISISHDVGVFTTTGATSGAGIAYLPEHTSSPLVLCGVRGVQFLIFCVVFWRSLFVLLTFSYGHCVVCHSLITPLVSSNISPRRTEINVDILLFGGFHYLILFVYIMPIWPLCFDVHLKKDKNKRSESEC
jgi:hypothetical protein